VRTAGILLAAGRGSRYGMPKALAPVGGRLMSERALATLRDGGADPIVVVVGAGAAEVRARLAPGTARLVDNPDWATGMGSSLRTGLEALAGHDDAEAAVVLLVDTPGITPAAVARLIAAGSGPDALLAASYRGKQGHPVLLGRAHWDGVRAAAVGDTGAKPYLAAHRDLLRLVPCDDIADGTDVDTPPAADSGRNSS